MINAGMLGLGFVVSEYANYGRGFHFQVHIPKYYRPSQCVEIVTETKASDPFGSRIRLATTTEMQRAKDKPAAMMNKTPTENETQIVQNTTDMSRGQRSTQKQT